MTGTSIRQPYKTSYLKVLIINAAFGAARYTDWSSDVVSDDGDGGATHTYYSNTSLEATIGLLTGGLEDKPTKIELTLDSFLSRLSDGTPHAPMTVKVWEVIESDAGGTLTQITLFRGRVAMAIRNYGGKSDRVLLECTSVKSRLKVAMGLPAGHSCINTFGDESSETLAPGQNCTIQVAALRSTGTATAISTKRLTITGVTTPALPVGTNYWHRGYVERQGLRILIRDWVNASPTYFELANFPPQSWVGQSVTLTPGCDKLIGTCRVRWANEANFNGFGHAVPSRNPTLEK